MAPLHFCDIDSWPSWGHWQFVSCSFPWSFSFIYNPFREWIWFWSLLTLDNSLHTSFVWSHQISQMFEVTDLLSLIPHPPTWLLTSVLSQSWEHVFPVKSIFWCFKFHMDENFHMEWYGLCMSYHWYEYGPSVTTPSTDFSFQNLVFWNLFEFSVAEIAWKSISATLWIQLLPSKFH